MSSDGLVGTGAPPTPTNVGGTSDGAQTLASSDGDKKRAAKYLQEHLLSETQAAGCMAESGGQVRPPMVGPAGPSPLVLKQDTGLRGLSSWATDAGLSDAMTVWQGQVGRLMGQLNRELQALQGTRTIFQSQEIGAYSQLHSVDVPPPLLRSSFNDM
jgi:hypothetical protein